MTEKKIFALGFFDGVHLGHQALLQACRTLAQEKDAAPAAITFDRHPMSGCGGPVPPLLSTAGDRCALLRQYGMETVCCLPTTGDFLATDWQAFLAMLQAQGAMGFVCGDDFRFGAGGAGTAATLEAYCRQRALPCSIVPEQQLDGVRISSTHIRRLLEAGQPEAAARFLGHPHRFTGQVVAGQGIGHTLGTPTANLSVPDGLILPGHGVYACLAHVDGQTIPAVTNIGTRPTVGGRGVTVEPWLLDFEGNLYGRTLTLEFCKFLRPEQKFPSLEALQAEIRKNAAETRAYFRN